MSSCGDALIASEILDARWAGQACRGGRQLLIWRFFEPILDQQAQVIPLIEDLALDFGVDLAQTPHFAILLGDELLAHRGYLDVEIVIGKIEIRSEELGWCSIGGKLDGEFARFVFPVHLVEIEQSRKLSLAFMCEVDGVCRLRLFGKLLTQLAWASVTRLGTAVSSPGNKRWISPSSSSCTGPTAIPKTPWPRWNTSTTSSAL